MMVSRKVPRRDWSGTEKKMWFWTRNRRHYSIKTLETLIYELEVSRINVQQQKNSTYNKTRYLVYLFFQSLTSTLD